MSKDLGSIHIEIELETKRLLDGVRKSQRGLGKLSGVMENISSSTRDAESSMFSFSKAAQVVASSLNAGAIITAIDGWGQMASRIKTSLKSVEGDTGRYAEIQERFLEISNRNGKAIETTQSLYVGSAASLKEMGYNTAQTMDYIESLSSILTANATSAQQTESAMAALNSAMVTGTLSGNDWDSVLNGIPSSVGDVAQELSRLRGGFQVTESEVRQMAANGGIDMKLFVDAMINAKDANNILADSMNNTLAGGFTKLSNSAQAYYGELSQSSGVTDLVSAGFSVLSDNFDKVAAAANIAALVMGARMANALAGAGKEQLKSIANSVNQAKAELESAKASEASAVQAQRRAAAEVRNAQLDRARLENTINNNAAARQSVIMSTELTAAKERERAAKLGLIQSNTALAASSAAVDTASRAASVGVKMASGALSLVGGPVGVAMLAGAAIYYFWQKSQQAKQQALDFANGLDTLSDSMKSMNNVQLRGTIADANTSMRAQQSEIDNLGKSVASLREQYERFTPEAEARAKEYGTHETYLRRAAETTDSLAQAERDLADGEEKLAKIKDTAAEATRLLNNNMLSAMKGHDGLIEKGKALESVQAGVAKIFGTTADEVNRANQASQKFNPQSLQITPATTETQNPQEKPSETYSSGSVKPDEAAQYLARQKEQLDRLNTGYAEGSLELAKYDAVKALGIKATSDQITAAKENAAAIYEQTQAVNNLAQAEQFIAQEMASRDTKINTATDPTAQITLQEQQKLQILNNYQALGALNAKQYEDGKTAILQQATSEREAIVKKEAEQYQNNISSLIGASADLAGSFAGAIGNAAGESSSAYQAMFAISKGFALAQAGLNLQIAMSNAMAAPWPRNIPAIIQAMNIGGQIVSTISGMVYGGGRYNGGPVSASSMYRVGENGLPEIFKANNGNQYMIPGDNGRVISNRDIQGGEGGSSVVQHITFEINTTGGIDPAAMTQMESMMKRVALFQIHDQATRPGGKIQPRK